MAEIISFKTRQRTRVADLLPAVEAAPPEMPDDEETVWSCPDCDSQSFQLWSDGRVDCDSCGRPMHDIRTFDPVE